MSLLVARDMTGRLLFMSKSDNNDFNGFRPRQKLENFTQIPNEFFEIAMDLKESELKIMLVIFRQTYGWIKEINDKGEPVYKIQDYISLSQFEDKTNLSRRSITNALKSLREKGFIVRTEEYNPRKGKPADAYAIKQVNNPCNDSEKDSYPQGREKFTPPGEKSTPPPREKFTPTKERSTKHKTNNNKGDKHHKNSDNLPSNDVRNKFKKIFHRELDESLYKNILSPIYNDQEILLKALEVTEKNAHAPSLSYLVKVLTDWKKREFNSIMAIKKYLENRSRKPRNYSNKSKAEEVEKKELRDKLHDPESLEKNGWI